MKHKPNARRRFITAGLAILILNQLPWATSFANTIAEDILDVPDHIQQELVKIYGDRAIYIAKTNLLNLKVPVIAENGAVVPVTIRGERASITSLAILVAKNRKPLTSISTFFEGSDVAVSLRIKLEKTSDVFVVAETNTGLVGVKRLVKVTIGCGGF